MNIEEQWVATEECLLGEEVNSFGGMLEQFRGRISPLLIGGREWERLLERARELPVTMAAFPFGFELPLHERRPRADLGVTVISGSRSAGFFEERGWSEDADPYMTGIVRLLDEIETEESPLRQIVGRKMMLEYDIESAQHGAYPDPGIFLRPAERPIVGDGTSQRFQDIGVVLDAMASVVGWDMDAAVHQQAEQVYLALTPATRIDSFGVFPSRERAIRLAMTGFQKTRDVMAFLEHAGWSGQHSIVASTVSRLEARDAFVNIGVHFDVREDGLGPTLGLSLFTKDREPKDSRYWLDNSDQWTALIDGIREEGLAVPEKLSELANWPSAAEALFGKSGMFVLMRGIHHIKLALTGDQFEKVKAYVFLLMRAWRGD